MGRRDDRDRRGDPRGDDITPCLREVVSPSFWKLPNSTCSVILASIPVNTSRKIVLAPCHKWPKKNNANTACPNVYQPRGLLLNTPSDSKLVRSNSKTSPNCAFRAYFLTVGASLNVLPFNLPP